MPVGETFLFSKMSKLTLGPTQTSVQWILRVKWTRLEINYLLPSGARVKSKWNCTSAPALCFHGVQKENPTFFFFFPTTYYITENGESHAKDTTAFQLQVFVSGIHKHVTV